MSKQSRKGDQAAEKTKRERFEEAGKFPLKKVLFAVGAVAVIAVGAVVGFSVYGDSTQAGGPVVTDSAATQEATFLEMSPLTAQTTDAGTVTLSLAELKAKTIGGFIYSRSTPMPAGFDSVEGNGLPLLAYVAPSGKLVVATSLCEPCRSWDFHIESGDLVCNACFTRWNLDTLQGVEGGCLDYPPEELTVSVDGDVVQIQQAELEAWMPRI